MFQTGSWCFFELSFCISLHPTIPTIVQKRGLNLAESSLSCFRVRTFFAAHICHRSLESDWKDNPRPSWNEFATSQLLLEIPNSTKHMDESSWKQCGTSVRHSHAKPHWYDSYTFTHPWWEGKLTGRTIDPHRSPPRFAKVVLYKWQLMTVNGFLLFVFPLAPTLSGELPDQKP